MASLSICSRCPSSPCHTPSGTRPARYGGEATTSRVNGTRYSPGPVKSRAAPVVTRPSHGLGQVQVQANEHPTMYGSAANNDCA